MNVSVNVLIDNDLNIRNEKIIGIVTEIVNQEGFKLGEIEINIVTERKLLEINIQFLNHNYHTDIITFDNSFMKTINGELYLSYEYIVNSAKRLNISFLNELYRIIIHGVLHLCKYKDSTPEQKRVMTEREDFYLEEYK